jgi:hypothetical protein
MPTESGERMGETSFKEDWANAEDLYNKLSAGWRLEVVRVFKELG